MTFVIGTTKASHHLAIIQLPEAMSQPIQPVVPQSAKCQKLGFLHARYNGRMIPAFIDPKAADALSQTWDTTEHDILICTHQKVGTHLTKKFIVEILRTAGVLDTNHPAAGGDIGKGAVPWPEVTASQNGVDAFLDFLNRTKGQPRVFYTHANIDELPVRNLHPKTKLVMTYRDPKGAAVSQYHFYKKHPTLGVSPDLTMAQFVNLFVDGDLYFGDYHQHVKSYFEASKFGVNPAQLCILRYEDLVEDKVNSVKRLSQFLLGHPLASPEQEAAVADSTEFNTMKNDILTNPGTFHFNANRFFRSGRTDDWKAQLTEELANCIDQKTEAQWGTLRAPLAPVHKTEKSQTQTKLAA